MLPWATSLAVAIRVGNLLGEGQPRRARSTFRAGPLINGVMAVPDTHLTLPTIHPAYISAALLSFKQ